MKLLFDEQLSPRLVSMLAELFPGSHHVHDLGLGSADDLVVGRHAADHGYLIVTKDSDYADLAIALGTPPQIVWLRLGNCSTTTIERILRRHAASLSEFGADPEAAVLTIEQ